MTVASVDTVERNVHKTNEWLKDLGEELGTDDRETLWRFLRAYLMVLRDRLTVEEAAQLSAQLPELVRGVFFEGFDPTRQPQKIRDREEFIDALIERAQPIDRDTAVRLTRAGTEVLRRHVTEGELDDVLSQLPAGIREMLARG
jgi:uncharacterized protein (DUF2267 family)